jgi:hypothetical protein
VYLSYAVILISLAIPLIDRAAEHAQMLWEQLPTLQCTERIAQKLLDESGRTIQHRESSNDYVLFLRSRGSHFVVEESRVPQDKGKPADETLLSTSGFPSLPLLFHHAFSDGFEFDESLVGSGQEIVAVLFRAKPDVRPMAALKVSGRVYPIHWRGIASVQQSTGAVVRIQAYLADPREVEALGIRDLNVDVQYSQTAVGDPPRSLVLPIRTIVRLTTARQRWETTHEFSHYRSFSVTTTTRPPGGGE